MPIVNVRNDEPFNPRYSDLTPARLRNIYGPDRPEAELFVEAEQGERRPGVFGPAAV